jgi:uncharacterized protein YjiS (DUF1127 family)
MSNRHFLATFPERSPKPGSLLLDAMRLVETWFDRAQQRRALRRLPDHVMRDMALTQADVEAEAAKPFWQA